MRMNAPRLTGCGNAACGDLLATAALGDTKTAEDALRGQAAGGLKVGTKFFLVSQWKGVDKVVDRLAPE